MPSSVPAGPYTVTVTGISTTPAISKSTSFIVNVAPNTSPQSIVFSPTQYLTGSVPASLDSLTNWRYEFRLHDFLATLPVGTARLVGLGSTTLSTIYFYNPYAVIYQLALSAGPYSGTGAVLYGTANNDLFVRVQRSGSDLTLNVWQIESNGTYTSLVNNMTTWTTASLSPGFSLGAATDQDAAVNGRLPSSGRMAFFRFYDSAIVNTTTPTPCDATAAPLRYEFTSSLANTGTATAATLLSAGGPVYQPTPGDSCALGGPPSFNLVAGAQSPSSVTQGQTATYPVTINRQNFTGAVNFLGCTGPAGVTCFAAASSSNSAQVSVSTTAATPIATHTLVLNASDGGSLSAAANLSLTVAAATAGSASLALTTPSIPAAVRPGSSTSTNFAISSNNYSGTVNVGCLGVAGVTCTPTSVNVVPGSNNVTLQLNVAANAPGGVFSLTLSANGVTSSGQFVSAPAVATTLVIVRCYLENLDVTSLPLNPGAPIRLSMVCAPPASPGDTINWQLLDSTGALVTANAGTATGVSTVRQYNAPANSTNGLVTYFARATYNGSALHTADFRFNVNPPIGIFISPQANPPYVINPGGQLPFGVNVVGTTNTLHTCSANEGTVAQTNAPGFSQGWVYYAPTVTYGQVNVVITCISSANSQVQNSFPLLVNPSINVPPTVTSITWGGNGGTGFFHSVNVQGTHPLPAAPPQAVSLRISKSADDFSVVNACWQEVYGIAYGSQPTASWRLWDDSGASPSYDQGLQTSYLYPSYYYIYYKQNSQCQANYYTQASIFYYNYGPAAINYYGNTITVTHGIRYLPSFIGNHAVWGQITLYTGLQSAWTAPPVAPVRLTVQ